MSLKNYCIILLFLCATNIDSQYIRFIFHPSEDMVSCSQLSQVQKIVLLADENPNKSLVITGFFKNQDTIARHRMQTVANLALSNGIARSRIRQQTVRDPAKINVVEVSI